jgi:hypothetical protein
MALRTSMSELIDQVRGKIQDRGNSSVFSDEQIQAALDAHQCRVRYLQLCGLETRTPAGVQYLEFTAEDHANWEADAVITDTGYNTVTPAQADYLGGFFTFAQTPNYPLTITGKTFDVYAASADLLEEWAAKLKLDFDFSEEGVRMNLSQRKASLLGLVEEYRRKQKPRIIEMVRDELFI